MTDLSIASADTDADAVLIYNLLTRMHAEARLETLNPDKALIHVFQVVANGVALMVMDGDYVVASLGMELCETWYSNERSFFDTWFYVLPDYRKGPAAKMLLAEAKTISDMTGHRVRIHEDQPNDRRARSSLQREAYVMNYVPGGTIITHVPAGAAHVRQ